MEYMAYKDTQIVPRGWFDHPERVTDAQIEVLRAEAATIDAHNQAIYEDRVKAYRGITEAIRAIWGSTTIRGGDAKRIADYIGKYSVPKPYGAARRITDFLEKRASLERAAAEKRKQDERQAAIDKYHRERQHRLSILAEKYKLENAAFASADDVLDVVRAKSKYLDLALEMEATRNDWSDGFYRVRHVLNTFARETPQDEKIYDDVQACLESEDDDRVFRDNDWNYNKLYALVDDDLAKDARELLEMTE